VVLTPSCECGEGHETIEHQMIFCSGPIFDSKIGEGQGSNGKGLYSVLQGIGSITARLTGGSWTG
jgi:hypothetical protein